MKTYVFSVEVEQEEDGRWSAEIPALPGCAAWDYTKEKALEALRDSAEMYLEVLKEYGDHMPWERKNNSLYPVPEVVTITI